MSQYRARHWAKDGKERIYVNLDDAPRTAAGYVDVLTGFTRSNDPAQWPVEDIYAAAATFAVSRMMGLPAPRYDNRKDAVQHASDLSATRAGDSLKEESKSVSGRKGLAGALRGLVGGTAPDSWAIGARGEKHVGRLLDKAKDVHAIHSVVINEHGADIDHVEFSPYGIYVVNTKTHPGATVSVTSKGFFVNGSATDYLRKSRAEAQFVADRLTRVAGQQIPVTPVICLVETREVRVNASTGVLVVTDADLLSTVRLRQSVLTPEQVDWLFRAASDPQTWSRRS